MPELDLDALRALRSNTSRYSIQLARLHSKGIDTARIEKTVSTAASNVVTGNSHSFVIFGEPQSGKTEMMICLTAKLLDERYDIVIHLLNDSVQLLEQNLDRFKRSGLAPAARNFTEILDPDISLKTGQHVIFCKKNAKDLQKLLDKTYGVKKRIVIDDEADYATPNAKVNVGEVTKINNLIKQLLSDDGYYIGVTATPARLDLNNTLDNDSASWVWFPPHAEYTGQEQFFPLEEKVKFRLNLIKDEGDQPKFLREALFRFMVTVAYLNSHSRGPDINFSMLIHTSGKKEALITLTQQKSEIALAGERRRSRQSASRVASVAEIWALAIGGHPVFGASRRSRRRSSAAKSRRKSSSLSRVANS